MEGQHQLAALSQLSSCFCGARAGPAALCTSVLQPLPFGLVAGCVWQLTNNQAGAGLWPAATSPAARLVQLRPRASPSDPLRCSHVLASLDRGLCRPLCPLLELALGTFRAKHSAARRRRPRRRASRQPRSRHRAALVCLYAEAEPAKFERAALRWHARFVTEASASLVRAQIALTALAELRVGSDAATKQLRELARSPGGREDASLNSVYRAPSQ